MKKREIKEKGRISFYYEDPETGRSYKKSSYQLGNNYAEMKMSAQKLLSLIDSVYGFPQEVVEFYLESGDGSYYKRKVTYQCPNCGQSESILQHCYIGDSIQKSISYLECSNCGNQSIIRLEESFTKNDKKAEVFRIEKSIQEIL